MAADVTHELKLLDVGTYAEIMSRSNPHGYTVAPIPSLVSILLAAERRKGTALTEEEVRSIRDSAGVMVLPDKGELLEERRSYEDIDPVNCWREWQRARVQFSH